LKINYVNLHDPPNLTTYTWLCVV